MSKISNEKAYEIARRLTNPLSEKTEKIWNSTVEFANEKYKGYLPKDVLDFQEKYPKSVKVESIYINGIYVNLKYPYYLEAREKLIQEYRKYISQKYKEYRDMREENSQLHNKIQCTLTKLGTYKRIREEFPEAYTILMELVDSGSTKGSSICDDVEGLRAQLSTSKK